MRVVRDCFVFAAFNVLRVPPTPSRGSDSACVFIVFPCWVASLRGCCVALGQLHNVALVSCWALDTTHGANASLRTIQLAMANVANSGSV